ncbi:MAG: D-ribitol-5-phosphate cytidylyltransferase [Oscillospiraceae bacterium]|nr:D-ribitol-5-phosphate cytidylyltransferase [Oscillospiraceae bacterium]
MIFAAILGHYADPATNSVAPNSLAELDNKPIIVYSAEKLLASPRIDAVFISINSDWLCPIQQIINSFLPNYAHRIHLIPWEGSHNNTLQNILYTITQMSNGNEEDIIIVHDANRPFITSRIIEENIDAAINFGAANTVCPAIDTIVISHDGSSISDIPNKAFMYCSHSPQSFQVNVLKNLYSSLSVAELASQYDPCKLCSIHDLPVALVRSEYTNIKVSAPSDYPIAEAYVARGIHL